MIKPKHRRIIQIAPCWVTDRPDGITTRKRQALFVLTDDGEIWARDYDARRQCYETSWYRLSQDIETQT